MRQPSNIFFISPKLRDLCSRIVFTYLYERFIIAQKALLRTGLKSTYSRWLLCVHIFSSIHIKTIYSSAFVCNLCMESIFFFYAVWRVWFRQASDSKDKSQWYTYTNLFAAVNIYSFENFQRIYDCYTEFEIENFKQ